MMKYLLYFFVLVSVFLTSGSSSTPENQQKYKDIYTMYSPNEDKTEYNIPQADIERHAKELYNGKQSYKGRWLYQGFTIPQHLHIKKLKDKPILIRRKDRTVYKNSIS